MENPTSLSIKNGLVVTKDAKNMILISLDANYRKNKSQEILLDRDQKFVFDEVFEVFVYVWSPMNLCVIQYSNSRNDKYEGFLFPVIDFKGASVVWMKTEESITYLHKFFKILIIFNPPRKIFN